MSFLDPQFKVTRARGCMYLLLSRFYIGGFQDKEIRLSLGLMTECIDAMPEVFWTDRIPHSHLQEIVSDITRVHEEDTSASFCDYYSVISAAQESSPPFETFYLRPSARRRCLALIEEAYAASSYADSLNGEAPDHLSTELHHLHLLSVNEAEAVLEDKAELAVELRRKQATFLWKHLRTWIPDFSNSVQNKSRSNFAALLAKAVDLFTELDAMYLSFLLVNTTDLYTELDSICRSSSAGDKSLLMKVKEDLT